MTTDRRARGWLGALILLHLALGLIGPYVVLVPMIAPPADFLETAAAMSDAARLSVMVLVIGGLIPLGITGLLWPAWRDRLPILAPWLLVLATTNLALQMVENSHWLTLLSVSQAYNHADSIAQAGFHTLADVVRASFSWSHYSHILILVLWLLIFHMCLLRTGELPRPLALAGATAAVIHLVGIPLPVFLGHPLPEASYYGLPLAVAYFTSGIWLLARSA